ncbi:MAG: hypothetical protein AAGA32_14165 [Pseudomonadota bacterium]
MNVTHIESEVVALLTEAEREEISAIAVDDQVVSHALFSADGEELGGEVDHEDLVPVVSNLADLGERFAELIGEEDGCHAITSETATAEVAVVSFTAMKAVVVRRRKAAGKGLRHVR